MGPTFWKAILCPLGHHPPLPLPQGVTRKTGSDAYHYLGVVDSACLNLDPHVGQNKPICLQRWPRVRNLWVEL